MPKRQRTISYGRADWEGNARVTLEAALRDELSRLPEAVNTRLDFGDRFLEVRDRRDSPSAGIRLHIVCVAAA